MTPHAARNSHYNRRAFLAATLGSLGLGALSGCANPLFRGQSPEVDLPTDDVKERKLVGDFTRPWGLNWIKVESVALVTGLDNTGSDPPPNEQRRLLIAEMQSHEVPNADKILASPATSMVIVRGYLPPGAQKGQNFDIEVLVPKNTETTSLAGGWLMQTRLRRLEVLGGTIRSGDVDAIGRGNVLVNSVITGTDDKINNVRGRVLGGGLALESRTLGLMLRREDASVRVSTLIGKAINNRFHTMDRGQKKGVAKPMRDNFLELNVANRYKNNLGRYLRVVRNIVLQETAVAKTERLEMLGRKLQEPSAAPLAALQLEAIGRDAIGTLKTGLTNSDPEVRFYSAEALAYLDDAEASAPLELAARETSAFRWHALTALSSMNQSTAYDALTNLLHAPSVETRYGAFRALRLYNDADPVTKGELLEGKFYYHLFPTTAEPLVHVTRSKQPEIVIFGHEQTIKPPQFLTCGKGILLKAHDDGQIKVCSFKTGPMGEDLDSFDYCPPVLNNVIRTVTKLGASYAEVVLMLKEANKQGLLTGRFAIEALPTPGRKYYRDNDEPSDQPPVDSGDDSDEPSTSLSGTSVATPQPELFTDRLNQESGRDQDRSVTETYIDPDYAKKDRGILDRLNPLSGN
ncbi:flagellar basal body P-ring protein FlgI [Anatilimnocola sp. NA78]|uniref:flagellar basal body P-ring protein FlgI n=1 Tax=Anatilimnocola sp. NA78 TaxID=3415683 RepID=UPI003CE54C5F